MAKLNTENRSGEGVDIGMASFESAYERLVHERPGVLASEWGGELAWLRKARDRDAARWQSEGLPTRRQEKWHYTSVAPIAESRITLLPSLAHGNLPSREVFSVPKIDSAIEIVFLNGHYVPEWSSHEALSGVSVVVLSELFEECVNDGWTAERKQRFAAFREHVESSDADRETVFAAMNTSFMQDGVLVHLKSGVHLEKPVVITYLTDSPVSPGAVELPMITPRVFVHLDRRAEAGLIEVYAGREGGRYFSNAVSDVRLEEGARLSYCKVQSEATGGVHIGTTRVHQKRDSYCENFQFSFGAGLSRQDLHVGLEGEGAETVLDGLYMVGGKQHVDNHTSIEHVVGHTTSEQLYKGILDGDARAVFNGHVRIHQDAQKSNSSQLNNNLLLSPRAEADTKPELEIYADDVKAAHGATIGRIDPEHIFYLQARAVPKDEAVRILSRGFAQDVVFRIKNERIRTRVGAVVDARFDAMQMGEKNV
jgi:Fe-S cluster assembly protein SufD